MNSEILNADEISAADGQVLLFFSFPIDALRAVNAKTRLAAFAKATVQQSFGKFLANCN